MTNEEILELIKSGVSLQDIIFIIASHISWGGEGEDEPVDVLPLEPWKWN